MKLVGAVALAFGLLLGGGSPFELTVTGPGHSPKVNKRWYYVVSVTRAGKPVAAKLTEQIVDPLGGSHPVEFGPSTKKITSWPFTGTFRDYIIWPPESRGIPLKLRVIVVAGTSRRTVDYHVTPRR